MAKDDYIKHLMKSVRAEGDGLPIKNNHKVKESPQSEREPGQGHFLDILQQAKHYKIEGDKRRMIKMDRKNEAIIKVLYPVLGVDASRFINLLIANFIEENPGLVQEIKEIFKEL